ncbi:MAG TPA: hypothetical protein DCS93_00775 [Microscillaceae bacterium]|nr:hypothetical protein [Microscillaceae bacterium]
MKTLLASVILMLSPFYSLTNAQVATTTTNSCQPQKTKKLYLPKSVKNFTGDGKIDQTMVPRGTKDQPTYIRLWKGSFEISNLVGYVSIIVEPRAEITFFYPGSGKTNVSIYAKNESRVNISRIIDKGLDKVYLEKKAEIKTYAGIVGVEWVREGNPIPQKLQSCMERYENIITYGAGNLKEFYNTYTTKANGSMLKYKLGTFSGLDYQQDDGKDIFLIFTYNPDYKKLYIGSSTKYSAKNKGYQTGNAEWIYVDGKTYMMNGESAKIPINSHTKDFIKIRRISYATLERNKIKNRQSFSPELVVDMRPLKQDMAQRNKRKAIEEEQKKKRLAQQAKIDARKADPKNWKMGDRVCLKVVGSVLGLGLVRQKQPIRAVIEYFNEDRSRVKVKILESGYNGTVDGEKIYKGNLIWITPKAVYRGNIRWMLCK